MITELRYLFNEWCKYMDSTVPEGVNRAKYYDLKYINKQKIKDLDTRHPNLNHSLLEMVALKHYLQENSEENIIKELSQFYEEIL